MVYVIRKSNGGVLVEVPDDIVNNTASSLALVGRGSKVYGQHYAENFVHLLENFAHTASPTKPITGQLWYDTGVGELKVFNGSIWRPVQPVATSNQSETAILNRLSVVENAAQNLSQKSLLFDAVINTDFPSLQLRTAGLEGAVGTSFNAGPATLLGRMTAAETSIAALQNVNASSNVVHLTSGSAVSSPFFTQAYTLTRATVFLTMFQASLSAAAGSGTGSYTLALTVDGATKDSISGSIAAGASASVRDFLVSGSIAAGARQVRITLTTTSGVTVSATEWTATILSLRA